MSGGRWNYMQEGLEEQARRAQAGFSVLAQIEHELDWGLCGDTCRDCAAQRVVAALIQFFDDRLEAPAALALLRDHQQNLCVKCLEHEATKARVSR